MLTPMERNVKTYLVNSMSKDLIELLAKMAVERPEDPHFWLGVRLLERSPNGPYIAEKRSNLVKKAKQVLEEEKGFSFGLSGGGGGGGLAESGGAQVVAEPPTAPPALDEADNEPPPSQPAEGRPAPDEYGTSPITVGVAPSDGADGSGGFARAGAYQDATGNE